MRALNSYELIYKGSDYMIKIDLLEECKTAETIVISGHIRPDGDRFLYGDVSVFKKGSAGCGHQGVP